MNFETKPLLSLPPRRPKQPWRRLHRLLAILIAPSQSSIPNTPTTSTESCPPTTLPTPPPRKPSIRSGLLPWYFLLLAVSALVEVAVYFAGTITARFYVVLGHRDLRGFQWLVLESVGLFTVCAATKACAHYVAGRLGIRARDLLTRHLHRSYLLDPAVFLQINQTPRSSQPPPMGPMAPKAPMVDNADQRITQDTERLASGIQTIVEKLALSPVVIVYYSVRVASVCGWWGTSMLYAYFLVSSGVCRLLMAPIVRLVYRREQREGAFRYVHQRLRAYAEPILFYQHASTEGNDALSSESKLADSFLERLLRAQKQLLTRDSLLRHVSGFVSDFGSVISYLAIALPLFSGRYDHVQATELSGILSANAFLCMYLIYKLTSITELAGVFSEVAGYLVRLSEILEVQERADREEPLKRVWEVPPATPPAISDTPLHLQLERVHFRLPSGRPISAPLLPLSSNVQMTIITGPNGCGKSSLFRILAGLWNADAGTIRVDEWFHELSAWPTISKHLPLLFLPQQSYLPLTTSPRDCITYPNPASVDEEQVYVEILERVGLDCDILQSLETTRLSPTSSQEDPKTYDLHHILTPGECQKLCFARALYWNPRLLFLDESTNAMDRASERKCIQACLDRGIRLVWITHHPNQGDLSTTDSHLFENVTTQRFHFCQDGVVREWMHGMV